MRIRFIVIVLICIFLGFAIPAGTVDIRIQTAGAKVAQMGEEAYQAILQFYQYDSDVPLDPAVIEKIDQEQYLRQKIVFTGARNQRVPGYLALPKAGPPPYPCILQIHGMTLSKSDWWEENSYHRGNLLTPKLLAAGIAVLALDYPYHGERSFENDFDSTASMLFRKRQIHRFRNMVIDAVIDYRRAIDYLETCEDIDSSRIGVIGSSIGGTMALILSAVDSRIHNTTACVAPALMHPIFPGQSNISAIAPYNFTRALKGRPVLMLMGRNDDFNYTVQEAQALYDLIDSPDKELHFYDCGHRLPEEYIDKALSWNVKYIKSP